MNTRSLVVLFIIFMPLLTNAQGFNSEYEVYSGDLNGDGLYDLYIKQKPKIILLHGDIVTPILIPPPVNDFILQQTHEKTFTVKTSVSGINTLNLLLASVEIALSDFNIDDHQDMVIKNISSVPNMSGIDDQIVFAPGNSSNPSVKAIDANFRKFFEEVYQWMLNPNYFDDNADPVFENQVFTTVLFVPEYCGTASEAVMAAQDPIPPVEWHSEPTAAEATDVAIANCDFLHGENYNVHYDFVTFWWTEAVQVGLNYDKFDQDAIALTDNLAIAQAENAINAQTQLAIDISQILRRVFGVEIMEGVLENGGTLDIESNIPTALLGEFRLYRVLDSIGSVLKDIKDNVSQEVDLALLEAKYRTIQYYGSIKGWDVAAALLKNFLDGDTNGAPVDPFVLDSEWLLDQQSVQEALSINRGERPRESGEYDGVFDDVAAAADALNPGESISYSGEWIAQGTGREELFVAAGTYTIRTTGDFTISKSNTGAVTVDGMLTHEFIDRYDWNPGEVATFDVLGRTVVIRDDDAIRLRDAGRAADFDMTATWQESYTDNF